LTTRSKRRSNTSPRQVRTPPPPPETKGFFDASEDAAVAKLSLLKGPIQQAEGPRRTVLERDARKRDEEKIKKRRENPQLAAQTAKCCSLPAVLTLFLERSLALGGPDRR
jgi:hypothetical protein